MNKINTIIKKCQTTFKSYSVLRCYTKVPQMCVNKVEIAGLVTALHLMLLL